MLLVVTCPMACQNYGALQVASDFDDSVDFSRYETFAQARPPRPSPANPRYNAIAGRRIAGDIDAALAQKGLTQVSWDEADLQVAFSVDGRPRTEIWVTNVGWYRSHVSSAQLLEGSLVIDMADRRERRIVWHGVARQQTLADDFEDEHARRAVEAILSKFPPPPARSGAD